MGFWDDFRSKSIKMMIRSPLDTAFVTKTRDAAIEGTQKLKDFSSDPVRREKIGRIATDLGKFAFESAVNDSLKRVTGAVQVIKIVRDGLKDQPTSPLFNETKKPEYHTVGMEQMQAKMEKMQEEINSIKLQNKISTECMEDSEPPKKTSKVSDIQQPDKKRVLIRSRL